jgi:hypothetical protein
MKRAVLATVTASFLLFAAAAGLRAEVKAEEKNQVKFEGMLGRMMGLFGGKAMKEGLVDTVAVKGNRKMTANEYTGQIIDLDEQKVYTLDIRKKSYEVSTFAEMRRRLQEAQEKAAKSAQGDSKKESQPQKQVEIDFSLKDTGQKQTINGFNCHEVLMTVTAREKGKTLEQSGGMVMTSHVWLTPAIAAMKEIAGFDVRYAKAMEGPYGSADSAEQMAAALAMYPALKDMMGKVQTEGVKIDGTAVLTETTMEAVKSPEQVAQEQKQQEDSADSGSPVRSIGGLLGRKLARKKDDNAGPKDRSVILTMRNELLKATPSVAPADLSIPAGFKEKK